MPARQVKSALRVLEVLELFVETQAPATVTEVCSRLGYPQSSTSMLLATLEAQGYLQFDRARRTYMPTLRVMLLGSWLHETLFRRGSLMSAMDSVRRRTGLAVLVGLRQGVHVRFILSLRSSYPAALHFPAGIVRPVCRSAAGKILLAEESDAEIGRIARRANGEAKSPEDRVVVADLMKEIRACRRQGWALSRDYPARGRSTLAVKLPALPGQPPMALALGARNARVDETLLALVEALREAAQGLSAAYAAQGEAGQALPTGPGPGLSPSAPALR